MQNGVERRVQNRKPVQKLDGGEYKIGNCKTQVSCFVHFTRLSQNMFFIKFMYIRKTVQMFAP